MEHKRKGKKNEKLCVFRLDWGSEVLQEYSVKYGWALRSINLLEMKGIWA